MGGKKTARLRQQKLRTKLNQRQSMWCQTVVLALTACRLEEAIVLLRSMNAMRHAHDAASRLGRAWLLKSRENKKGENIEMIKELLASTQSTQRVLWAYRQYQRKIMVVQEVQYSHTMQSLS